jgi:hypothetical protein
MKTFKFFKGQTGVRGLRAEWLPELVQNLNAYHSLDASEELTNMLSNEIAREVDNEILSMFFPTLQRITAQTIGSDLVSIQPLTEPTGEIFFMDYKYNIFTFKFFRG